jgi:pimeloyl-ACP methyl ester carboxylesterase
MRAMTTLPLPASAATLAFGQSRLARCCGFMLRLGDRVAPELASRLAVDLFFTPVPTKSAAARRRVPDGWQVEPQRGARESFTLLRRRTTVPEATPRKRVLLVHGWAGDALQMLPLANTLDAAGFDPVLMDLPAHGRSDGWRCTMPQIVRSLFRAQAAQADREPFEAIVAHSMGAVAALHAMTQGLNVKRLVALAPSATPASVLQWFGDAFELRPALRARMAARISEHEGMVLEQFEPSWLGARVTASVLLVHDRGDRMASFANSEALAHALPSARLHATHGLSHRRILDDAGVSELVMAHLAAP